MNLAWIAAVLRPRDVAPHPNFPDADFDHRGQSGLAAIVMGDTSRMRASSTNYDSEEPWADLGVRHAHLSLHSETLRKGLAGLRTEVLTSVERDPARRCALALMACNAAAELEDYEFCNVMLGSLILQTRHDSDAGMLVTAVLLQQQALRLADTGRPYIESSTRAAELLAKIDVRRCPEFQLSPGIIGTYTQTLTHVVEALRQSAWSLLPRFGPGRSSASVGIPSVEEQVRTPTAEQLLWIAAEGEQIYSRFVQDIYKQLFRSRARELFRSTVPDLFQPTLGLELLGHASVYAARKELAVMRLAQAVMNPGFAWNDTLRLLRNAGASDELSLAIDHLRNAGPLSALSEDARQVLLQRGKPALIRSVELQVIQAAAELLTPVEVQRALASIFAVIDSGGPMEFPRTWQQPVSRLGEAWLAAALVANASGTVDIGLVADKLLQAAQNATPEDPLWDSTLSKALQALDWARMPTESTSAWSEWFTQTQPSLPMLAEVFSQKVDMSDSLRDVGDITSIEDVASRLNRAMRGRELSPDEVTASLALVQSALVQIRQSAANHVFGFGGIRVADVAAALIIYGRTQDLWADLAPFLADSQVARSDRSAAFERFAGERPPLPRVVADQFRDVGRTLLMTPDPVGPPGDQLVPYPELLRFLSNYDLLDTSSTLMLVAQLAGSANVMAREEAARTVASLASHRTDSWLLAVATQLSNDAVPTVKAHAGRALALLASREASFEVETSQRLTELLREDGVLVPFFVLSELRASTDIPEAVIEEIVRLSTAHPSRFVRDRASALATRALP